MDISSRRRPRRHRSVRRRCSPAVAVLLAAALVTACTACSSSRPTTAVPAPREHVVLDSGAIRGRTDGDVLRYQGIPYAEPPVGTRRFAPPVPPAQWTGERPTTAQGSPCVQAGTTPGTVAGSEDCLRLDVTVPDRASPEPRPVMVWLHGGGFTGGSRLDYDPRRLAVSGDVVVVTVDFRLGSLAHMNLPGMAGGGNLLLLDQQAALRWVQRNAHVFGADSRRVTLFGESGGAVGVCGQLASPTSAGLFSAAILQSGSCGTSLLPNAGAPGAPATPFFRTTADSIDATRKTLQDSGCADALLACLQALPLTVLVAATGSFNAEATGTPTLPADPLVSLRAGHGHRVPVLSGTTRAEADLFAGTFAFLRQPVTDANVEGYFAAGFGDRPRPSSRSRTTSSRRGRLSPAPAGRRRTSPRGRRGATKRGPTS